MIYHKKEYLLLLAAIALAILAHIGPSLALQYISQYAIKFHKKSFNRMLKDPVVDPRALEYLKILINNYEFVDQKPVLRTLCIEDLENAVKNLKFVYTTKRILKISAMMNFCMLGPILISPIVFSIKKLKS